MKKLFSMCLYSIFKHINRKKMKVLSLYFHNPSPENFELIIKWAIKKKYNFIDLETFIKYLNAEISLNEKSIYFSFDDGWNGNIELIPICEKYNVPITIFVSIEPVISGNFWWEYFKNGKDAYKKINRIKLLPEDKFKEEINKAKLNNKLERTAITESELDLLNSHSLVNIQSHSYTHPILTNLKEDSLDFDLKASKEYLEDKLNKEIYAFCYPNGSFEEREVSFTKKYYKYAFSTIQDFPQINSNLYTIPRIALTDDYWSNLAKISGGWKVFKQVLNKIK